MLMTLSAYAIVFALAFAISVALTPFSRWLSSRVGATTQPGGRRHEDKPMPRLGAVPLYFGFVVAVIAAQFLPVPRLDPNEVTRLTGLLLGSTICFVFWSLDDVYEFAWLPQFVTQLLVGGIAIASLIFIEFFNNPFTGEQTANFPFVLTAFITLLWIGTMMNTVNFMDGLDGLSAGVGVIAGLMLFLNSAFFVEPAQSSVAFLPLAMMGACLGFLMYNFQPASIYLGGGAPLLGFWLATLSIIGGAKMATILLVMGLPLMDFAWQVFNRLRMGRNPMSGDRGHLHFRLLDIGFLSHRQIVVGYYAFCGFFGALTLFLPSRLYKFMAMSVMSGLIVIGFVLLMRQSNQKSSS